MPSPSPKKPLSLLDRFSIAAALATLLLGSYVVYARTAGGDNLEATFETMARASFLLPETLHGRDIEFETDYFGHRYKGNTKNMIDAYVLYYGAWEKYILFFLRDAVQAAGSEECVFVDVGANSGLHSLYMSSYAGAVHAIEPYPPAVRRIKDAVRYNELTNLFVHPVGFGAENAILPFSAPTEGNFGVGSFDERRAHGPNLDLEIVRADDYLPSRGVDAIDFLKIDIEGYERSALEGWREQLEATRPMVVMELSVDPADDSLFGSMPELTKTLPPDYIFYVFENYSRMSGAYDLAPLQVDFEHSAQYDIVATPKEKDKQLPKSGR